jgi:hypothetical protein
MGFDFSMSACRWSPFSDKKPFMLELGEIHDFVMPIGMFTQAQISIV